MDGVRVRITRDPRTLNYDFYFLERERGKTVYQLFPASTRGDSSWERVKVGEAEMRGPSLSFTEEAGRDVLQSLAEQLAQLGFISIGDAPQIGAMREHLTDMREQAARLFTLATKEK